MFRYGTSSNESIVGSSSADILYGNGGDDTLFGAAGRDYLFGGAGQDILYGGADGDLFVFSNQDARQDRPDWIMDFQSRSDQIDLRGLGVAGETFEFGALAAGSGPRVTYQTSGPLTHIMADWTRDGQADFHLILAHGASIDPRDFLL
jgi:Ca2+-binding RTX toxin-like protein